MTQHVHHEIIERETHHTVRVRERIRWSDTDIAGIMYFGNYTRLFEIGETELFRASQLPYTMISEEHGGWLLRKKYECEFFSPVLLDDMVHIEIFIENLGGASLTMRFLVSLAEAHEQRNAGTLLGSGSCTVVLVDTAQRRPKRIPDAVRERLQKFVAPKV